MLRKILKHDMRTMARSAVPMFITSGIISVVCCAMLYFTFSFAEEADTFWGAMLIISSFYGMGIMAIMIMSFIVSVMTAVRYYKSLFTDEGYLNMVLPVKTTDMFNAKLLSTLIWTVLSVVVAAVCCLISVFVPTILYDTEAMNSLLVGISELITLFFGNEQTLSLATVLSAVSGIVNAVESVLIIVTAITIGSVVMKKNKVFGSIIFYFVISFIQQNIIGIFEMIIEGILGATNENGYIIALVFNILISIAISVAMYIVNYYILNRRFNIE